VVTRDLLDAPPRYEHLVLRAGLPVGRRYADLRYEGNNKNFRGPTGADGLYRSGDETAADWRRFAAGVKGLVVLRDSLFSQPDHPVLQRPRALMMPPSWVAVAVAEVMEGRTPRSPISADMEDDPAWGAADSSASMFGSFPPSDTLFAHASRPLGEATPGDRARTLNARASVHTLARAAQAMVDAAPRGPDAVAAAGAAQIAASDRSYFGAELRRDCIIPIFVENPNDHEQRDEGKGMGVWDTQLPDKAIDLARAAVYARRLRDGALGIERYDLRDKSQRARARRLLEQLVPRGSTGPSIWLWVNGGSDGHGDGDPATPYIEDFRAELGAADLELSRVVLLSKPSVRPWGSDAKSVLEAQTDHYGKLGIPLSVQLNTRRLQALIKP
jgi:hypothetical protein